MQAPTACAKAVSRKYTFRVDNVMNKYRVQAGYLVLLMLYLKRKEHLFSFCLFCLGRSHCLTQTVLELTMQSRLASNSQQCFCLRLFSVENIGNEPLYIVRKEYYEQFVNKLTTTLQINKKH